ncbi:MAG: aspartate--tRNA(Asn) ligase [Myxococcota bacterium]
MYATVDAAPPPLEPRVGLDADWVGLVHHVRRLKGRAFVHLWLPQGLVQIVWTGELPDGVRPGATIEARGPCVPAALRDPTLRWAGLEVQATAIAVWSTPSEPMPVDLTKPELVATAETRFDLRPLTLRHPRIRAVFTIQDALVRGFRSYLSGSGFTEIHSPKIVAEGAEGGANVFELGYFGRRATLAQSPQFYKEFGTGVFGRVFEVGPVFRAEPHATSRHLAEYTSLDVELGPIRSLDEVMAVEVGALGAMLDAVRRDCAHEVALLGITLPALGPIPVIPFAAVKARTGDTDHDLSPSEEQAVSAWIRAETGSDWVFVTGYPSSKRPFYAMDDPADPRSTVSFDLLFRGVEITTGGQRIHELPTLEAKLRRRGMDPAAFAFFTAAHRHGLPPHGGFGLGLERLTARLCGLDNVRDATLFPRDLHRLAP